jgi:hypothetical protein
MRKVAGAIDMVHNQNQETRFMEHIIMSAGLFLAALGVYQLKANSLVAQKIKINKRR